MYSILEYRIGVRWILTKRHVCLILHMNMDSLVFSMDRWILLLINTIAISGSLQCFYYICFAFYFNIAWSLITIVNPVRIRRWAKGRGWGACHKDGLGQFFWGLKSFISKSLSFFSLKIWKKFYTSSKKKWKFRERERDWGGVRLISWISWG